MTALQKEKTMSKFEDFSGKITIEKGGESAQLKVNLADVTRDDMKAMNQIMQCHDKANLLPRCEIDLNPNLAGAAKVINALERRGFDVDINKENRTVEISKDVKFGDGYSLPGDPPRRAQIVFDREFGPTVEITNKHFGHEHANKYGWRERVAWHAVKNAYE